MFSHAIAPGWWHEITPLDCGYEACAPNHSFGPAVRPYYLLHYVLEGEGTFLKNGTRYRVRTGDLFVICPEELTTYRASQDNPWAYSWVSFRASETPEFL